ncbi:hypothetical protein FPSE5266_10363 [Fusarium pseudograminearum]|nr:hypothetical protein FPSE5266_10363 [Fusarium pseudograminearum]
MCVYCCADSTSAKSGSIAYERAPWPWNLTDTPGHDDLTLGISRTYKRWRLSHGKPIEEPPGGGSRAAGQKLTKSSTGPAVETKVQTAKPAPAITVVAGAPVECQGAKSSTKPPMAAVAAQDDNVSQAFDVLALEARAEKAVKVETSKEKAAVVETILKQEVLMIKAKKLSACYNDASPGNVFLGQSSIADIKETLRGLPLPVRDVFGARNE